MAQADIATDKSGGTQDRLRPEIREAMDADSHRALADDPANEDAKLDVALDGSFPTSDSPSQTRAGSSEPAVSSGYDQAAEISLLRRRARVDFLRAHWPRLSIAALATTSVAAVAAFLVRRNRS